MGATRFYWFFCATSGGFVLLALVLGGLRVVSPQGIELGTDALCLPRGRFRSGKVRVAYAEIQKVWEVQIGRQRLVYVMAGGKKFYMAAALFANGESYTEVRDFLLRLVEG